MGEREERRERERERESLFFFFLSLLFKIYGNWTIGFHQSKKQSWSTQ